LSFVEGSEEHSEEVQFVDTGLTMTKYVPHLLSAFDVEFDATNSDCNESYTMLQRSVCSTHLYLAQDAASRIAFCLSIYTSIRLPVRLPERLSDP